MKKTNLIFTALLACALFFAGCKKEEFVVTFNPNGGKGDIVTQHFTQKVTQSLMANTFTNRGFAFSGWNTNPNGSGKAYKDQESVRISEHLVLYAQWKPVSGSFTVTFKANGGTGEMAPQLFEAGVTQALSANQFSSEEYYFTGWNTSPNGTGKAYANEQKITAISDMTLYAQWKLITTTFFVTFYANGGEGVMEPQSFFGDESKELTANAFTRTDYNFTGWNTKANGTGYIFKDMERVEIHTNLALYAQWKHVDDVPKPCPDTPTVDDEDGNTYNTVQIGTQCWMKENLKTTKYNTGEDIPFVVDDYLWRNSTTEAMCYYDDWVVNSIKYGALYNGYAAMNGNLCPSGWHVPSNDEWNVLANALGGANVAGYKMKNDTGWETYWGDGNGSNESGFSGLPAGTRQYNFYGLGGMTYFWSSTESTYRTLSSYYYSFGTDAEGLYLGCSVRCVKD
jgi:uncharacterized protein (TIGR02145 family)/uncharacterized repeat protein (TIGR02543 family)